MNRRSIFAATPLAAIAMTMPGTSLGSLGADQAIVALCNQHLLNAKAFNSCPLDSDESPYWDAYANSLRAIGEAKPMTMAGLAAKAKLAKAESDDEWAWDLVDDLIRLGGVA